MVKKYPPGAAERWERIAESMCRSVAEVTHMAAKLKDNCYKIPGHEPEAPAVVEPPKKVWQSLLDFSLAQLVFS